MIVLIGMPGCGKSTIGRTLARRLDTRFCDADQAIERRIGCPIRVFFDREGEEAFRDVEEDVLTSLLQDGSIGVLATGGGAVLRPANRERMRAAAQVVYLKATTEEIMRRVRHDTKRPLLQVENPQTRLRELYAVRDPLYNQTAHMVIETGRGTVAHVINLILMQLDQARMPDQPPPSVET